MAIFRPTCCDRSGDILPGCVAWRLKRRPEVAVGMGMDQNWIDLNRPGCV
jgi:hypothetical protein